jgi:hypothetical protein
VQWGTDDEKRLRLLAPKVNGEHEAVTLGETVVLQPDAVRQGSGERWMQVQRNPTYRTGALTDVEGLQIRWHSPSSEQSSQVFCVSAFGSLRHLVDGQEILQELLNRYFPGVGLRGPWELVLEHCDSS